MCALPSWSTPAASEGQDTALWAAAPPFSPVPVMSVTKFSCPFPWPNFLSAMAAQFPSLSTHTGRCKVSERGVLRSTEFHSCISLVECSTIPSWGFTQPPVEMPELHPKQGRQFWLHILGKPINFLGCKHKSVHPTSPCKLPRTARKSVLS